MRAWRGVNIWIWAASVVLYYWIKDGGAGELAWLEQAAQELWGEATGSCAGAEPGPG